MHKRLIDTAPICNDTSLLTSSSFKVMPSVLTAGFPCQDCSCANKNAKQHGIDGKRSGLVLHIFRLLDECPSIDHVLLENSAFLLTRGLRRILTELLRRDFGVAFCKLSAAAVGGLHKRERIWILATRKPDHLRTMRIPASDWSQEPVVRIIRRQSQRYNPRLVLLGNSIVPKCAVTAFIVLR